MGKGGKGLKSALQSQQSRFKAKEKVKQAALVAEQKAKKNGLKGNKNAPVAGPSTLVKGKGKAKASLASSRRPTIPFKPTDRILLIGEGNFSFARSLVEDTPLILQSLPPKNITATAYDSEAECYEKYPGTQEIVSLLKEKGVEVLFSVDGTCLEKHASLKGKKWDRIVWNFPHAGKGIADQDRNILSNQVLILDFLRSAAKILRQGPVPSVVVPRKKKKSADDDDDDEEAPPPEDTGIPTFDENEDYQFFVPDDTVKPRGTVLITLRNVAPYTIWDVPRLAKNPPPSTTGHKPPNPRYTLLRSFAFQREAWKGYEHRMTKGERAHGTGKTGEGGEDRTWEFCLRDEPVEAGDSGYILNANTVTLGSGRRK
ncbi:hypothetical protein BDQ12DRAFT_624905 [Crucibulum laeve]|uniref:25S rRNA (uridine-N(3))-methyltransferase BMT5-like domain-containing protein n=1 Tax=Crucibulum laeve TaxID=68775 RepID=A0A5C3MLJ6_9AGAR|nr:hypothetical protein BDQ12DRAFT_624905 [Crucibulum laeve]